MSKLSTIKELNKYLKDAKSSWMFIAVVALITLGALIAFAEGSVIAPFIYTLF